MSILLDHCVPLRYLTLLQGWGYSVSLLSTHLHPQSPHPSVIAAAQQLDAVLLTVDTDFQNIRLYPPVLYPGIIVILEEHRTQQASAAQLQQVLAALYRDELAR